MKKKQKQNKTKVFNGKANYNIYLLFSFLEVLYQFLIWP